MRKRGANLIAVLWIPALLGCKPGNGDGGTTAGAGGGAAVAPGPAPPGGWSAMDVCRELEKASIAAGCTLQSDAASDEAHFRMPAVLYRGTYGQGMVARFPDDKMYGFMHRVATADPKMSGFPVFGSEKARVLVYLVSQGAVPDEIQAKTKGIIESLQ